MSLAFPKQNIERNQKSTAKPTCKAHTPEYSCIVRSWRLWVRTAALVFNWLPCYSCLPPEVSCCLFPPRLQMAGLIQQTCGKWHGCWTCSDRLLLCRRCICDLSTHRYWQYPPGQDFFVTFHSAKGEWISISGRLTWQDGRRYLQRCFLSSEGMLGTNKKPWDAEIYFNLDGVICHHLLVWQNLYWCQFSFFSGSRGKRQIIYINNYFIECIHTVKLQLLNHSWSS